MPSDLTQAKAELWFRATDHATDVVPCPTCGHGMAVDQNHAVRAVAEGRMGAQEWRYAQASHLTAAADGGRYVALECDRCNHGRNRAEWDAPASVDRVRMGKRAAGRRGVARIRDSADGWLR